MSKEQAIKELIYKNPRIRTKDLAKKAKCSYAYACTTRKKLRLQEEAYGKEENDMVFVFDAEEPVENKEETSNLEDGTQSVLFKLFLSISRELSDAKVIIKYLESKLGAPYDKETNGNGTGCKAHRWENIQSPKQEVES